MPFVPDTFNFFLLKKLMYNNHKRRQKMKTINYKLVIVLFCIFVINFCACGQVEVGKIPYEDLNDCKLLNGIQDLPKQGSPKDLSLKGFIFNFKTKKLDIDPLTKQDKFPSSYKEFRDSVIKAKTGDIYFKSVENHFLYSLSGRIKNLGKHFLYEFNDVKMSVPEEVFYTEKGEKYPGILTNVKLGESFLMTTLEGELVLFRLIAVDNDKSCCTIQWIKANQGTNSFEVPKGEIIQPGYISQTSSGNSEKSLNGSSEELNIDVTKKIEYFENYEKLTKSINTYLANRKSSIESLLSVLKNNNINDSNMKYLIIKTFGDIRAVEAAPYLSTIVDTLILSGANFSITVDNMYGCVPSLVKIGKLGAVACLKEIINLTQSDWDKPFKAKLLLVVIVRVEGEKFTRQILEDFKTNLTDEEQVKNIEKAIALIDEAISYDGPKEDIYSQLKKELIKASEDSKTKEK